MPRTQATVPPWSMSRAIGTLLGASVLAALMSEVLVGAAEGTGHSLGMTTAFIGIVFVAIVGGAAESGSAIAMGRKNRMDLALGIVFGSSIQIALFVAPVLVLASYVIAPQPLELSFNRAETGSLFMAVLLGTIIAGDGRLQLVQGRPADDALHPDRADVSSCCPRRFPPPTDAQHEGIPRVDRDRRGAARRRHRAWLCTRSPMRKGGRT